MLIYSPGGVVRRYKSRSFMEQAAQIGVLLVFAFRSLLVHHGHHGRAFQATSHARSHRGDVFASSAHVAEW